MLKGCVLFCCSLLHIQSHTDGQTDMSPSCDCGFHHGAHILPEEGEAVFIVVTVELTQQSDTSSNKRSSIKRVSSFPSEEGA